jgi:multidrug resistance efflux pump
MRVPLPSALSSVLRPLLTLAVLGATILLVADLWRAYMLAPWTRDGRISAEVVQVMPEVSGTVAEVRVGNNQRVRRGDILFVIDHERFRLAVDRAEAELRARREDVALKAATLRRRTQLGRDIVAAETIERAQGEAEMARAAYDGALAGLHLARLNLDRATIRAPVDGYVTNLRLRPGDYATAGATRVAIVDADSFWITGYFEETKLAHIAPGAAVEVHLMGFEPVVHGHVESIGRGIADSNESPDPRGLPSVNPVFTWVRLAQRIPVRIRIDAVPDGVTLAAGMTCSVSVGPALAQGRLLSWSRALL